MASRPRHGPSIQNRLGLMMLLYYLSRQLIDVLAALKENGQPMMAIENGSVRPGLQGARFAGKKREFYQFA